MVWCGLVKLLKLNSTQSVSQSVTDQGGHRAARAAKKDNSLPCNILMQIRFPNPLSSQTENLTTSMSANKNQGGNSQGFNDDNNASNALIT